MSVCLFPLLLSSSSLSLPPLSSQVTEDGYNSQIASNSLSFTAAKDSLRARLTEVDEKLFGLKELGGCKAGIESEMAALLATLEAERVHHFAQVQQIERAAVKNKEALKTSLLARLREAKVSMTAQAAETLATTKKQARSTHADNELTLSHHGVLASSVLKKNASVRATNDLTRRNLAVSAAVLTAVKSREVRYQKQIEELTKELQEVGKEVEAKTVELSVSCVLGGRLFRQLFLGQKGKESKDRVFQSPAAAFPPSPSLRGARRGGGFTDPASGVRSSKENNLFLHRSPSFRAFRAGSLTPAPETRYFLTDRERRSRSPTPPQIHSLTLLSLPFCSSISSPYGSPSPFASRSFCGRSCYLFLSFSLFLSLSFSLSPLPLLSLSLLLLPPLSFRLVLFFRRPPRK